MRIQSLHIYPVKGLRGLEVGQLEFDAQGPLFDRRIMIVDSQGRFLSQRTVPSMARCSAYWREGKLTLQEDQAGTHVVHEQLGVPFQAEVWGCALLVQEISAEASTFLSQVLSVSCRMVKLAPQQQRLVDGRYAPGPAAQTVFADAYPLLVTGTASLQALNQTLQRPIPMSRFRPNIVLETSEPFVEETWDAISVGGVKLLLVKPCVRCVVVNTDQRSGTVTDNTLRALAQSHSIAEFGPVFGVNAVAVSQGAIAKESETRVLSFRSAPWAKL
jgi:uncharacterized protein